jgi:hypothetical protein
MKERAQSRLGLFKKGEVLFPLFIFLIFLFLLRESSSCPSESRAFPKLIILGTLILSGSLLAVHFFFPFLKNIIVSPVPGGEEEIQWEWKTRGRFYRAWMSIGISLLTAFLFGFVFLIPASFISYTLLLGRKRMFWKTLFLSLVTAVFLYIVFVHFLGIPMTYGFLWRW